MDPHEFIYFHDTLYYLMNRKLLLLVINKRQEERRSRKKHANVIKSHPRDCSIVKALEMKLTLLLMKGGLKSTQVMFLNPPNVKLIVPQGCTKNGMRIIQ